MPGFSFFAVETFGNFKPIFIEPRPTAQRAPARMNRFGRGLDFLCVPQTRSGDTFFTSMSADTIGGKESDTRTFPNAEGLAYTALQLIFQLLRLTPMLASWGLHNDA